MHNTSRRQFISSAGACLVLSAIPLKSWTGVGSKARVVIVGGGFGGATCAKYLKMLDPSLHVTLIERETEFRTCPFSNLYLGGLRAMDDITHSYDTLKLEHNIDIIHETVSEIDAAGHKVTTKSKTNYRYDKLVVSPGISFVWNGLPGYDEEASKIIPHAWQAGAQTELLRKQIVGMQDGGTVIISAPGNPFRCPPGPYERTSMIAHYLKTSKPKSKILILDAKDKFSKQGLFMQGWEELYPGMIEWVSGSNGGVVEEVDVKSRVLIANSGFDSHKGDVINVIPPQKAGTIVINSNLTDATGWCPVDQHTFESTRHKDIHIIGDAAIAGKMPKSGFAASSQGKVCAAAIVTSLTGDVLPEPSYANTCYSLVGPEYGISVSDVYRLVNGKIEPVKGAGGVSPMNVGSKFREKEASYARGWYSSITADIFG